MEKREGQKAKEKTPNPTTVVGIETDVMVEH